KPEDLTQQTPQEAGAHVICSAAKHELTCLCLQKSRQHNPSQKSELARMSTREVICRSDSKSGLAKLGLYRNSQGTAHIRTPQAPDSKSGLAKLGLYRNSQGTAHIRTPQAPRLRPPGGRMQPIPIHGFTIQSPTCLEAGISPDACRVGSTSSPGVSEPGV
ncbi:hypothetical protein P7K49_028586, partial [Saguinus oedipus]